MPVGAVLGPIVAILGGLMAGSKHQQNAIAYEEQKNARELLEKTVIGPAVQNGQPQILKVHEKTLKQHYTQGQLDVLGSMAEANSFENNLKNTVKTLGVLGGQQPTQPQPAGGAAPPPPIPTGVSASNASSGTPDVLQALTGPAPAPQAQQVSGPAQPSSDPRDTTISTLRAQADAQTKYIAQLEGRDGVQPTAQPQPKSAPNIMPLAPKINATIGPTGRITSTNATNITNQQQAAHIAGAQTKLNWLQQHPEVSKNNPGIENAIAAGDEASHKLVEKMQNEGTVDPSVLLGIESNPNLNWKQRNEQVISAMGVKEGTKYLAENPQRDEALAKDIEAKFRTEAIRLSLASGGSGHSINPDIMQQAQKNVLDKEISETQRKSDVTFNRMKTISELRAGGQIMQRTALNLTKDVAERADFAQKGRMLLNSIIKIGDSVFSGKEASMPTLTGVAVIDNPIKEAMAKFQSGNVGAKLAVVDSLANDMSIVEQRLFGGGSRIVESLRKATLGAIANPTRQNQATFNEAMAQSHRVMTQAEETVKTKIKAAASMLRSSPLTKGVADAFEKGHYDATRTYLEQVGQKVNEPDFLPVIPQDNNWAPVGR